MHSFRNVIFYWENLLPLHLFALIFYGYVNFSTSPKLKIPLDGNYSFAWILTLKGHSVPTKSIWLQYIQVYNWCVWPVDPSISLSSSSECIYHYLFWRWGTKKLTEMNTSLIAVLLICDNLYVSVGSQGLAKAEELNALSAWCLTGIHPKGIFPTTARWFA